MNLPKLDVTLRLSFVRCNIFYCTAGARGRHAIGLSKSRDRFAIHAEQVAIDRVILSVHHHQFRHRSEHRLQDDLQPTLTRGLKRPNLPEPKPPLQANNQPRLDARSSLSDKLRSYGAARPHLGFKPPGAGSRSPVRFGPTCLLATCATNLRRCGETRRNWTRRRSRARRPKPCSRR